MGFSYLFCYLSEGVGGGGMFALSTLSVLHHIEITSTVKT